MYLDRQKRVFYDISPGKMLPHFHHDVALVINPQFGAYE